MFDRRALLITGGAALLSGCASGPQGAVGGSTRYENGLWWNGASFVRGARLVRDGMFVRGGEATETVDLQGRYVLPPFADAHAHKVDAQSNAGYLEFGVFYFKNPNSIASIENSLEEFLARPDTIDRITAMSGITAPGGHPEPLYIETLRQYVYTDWPVERFYGDAFHIVSSAEQIEPALTRLTEQGADFVKIYVIHSDEFLRRREDASFNGNKGLDPALVPLIVRGAHARNLSVAAHIENAADFRVIVAAGADQAIHMPGYICSEDPLAQYEISQADAVAAARSGLGVVTTATVALRSEERLSRVSPIQRSNLLRLKAAGVPLYLGSDGYEHESVIKEARYLVELGVFDAREALRNLTFDTPRMIFPERRIGVLAAGHEASFVTLAANPLEDFNVLFTLVDRVKQGNVINVVSAPG